MRLYSFFLSSAAFRVRIALNLKGVEYETVPVNLPQGEHRDAVFLATNPQATVPVIDDDGTILWQSLAIIDYLDARFPDPRLIPAEPVARARVQALAQLIVCEMHPLNNLRVRNYLREELKLDEAGLVALVPALDRRRFRQPRSARQAFQRRPILLRRCSVRGRRLSGAAGLQRAPVQLRSGAVPHAPGYRRRAAGRTRVRARGTGRAAGREVGPTPAVFPAALVPDCDAVPRR